MRHSELEQLIIFPTLLLAKARFVTRVKSRWARSPFVEEERGGLQPPARII